MKRTAQLEGDVHTSGACTSRVGNVAHARAALELRSPLKIDTRMLVKMCSFALKFDFHSFFQGKTTCIKV